MQHHIFVAFIVFVVFMFAVGETTISKENIDEKLSILKRDILKNFHEIAEENAQLKKRVNSLEKGHGLSPKRGLQNQIVAFHAYRSSSISSIGQYHIIRFDKEMTDIGNGYNRHTGVYRVPSSGTYAFSWTIVVVHTSCITELVRNSETIGVTYPYSKYDIDTATVTVIKQVNAGDSVFVRTKIGCPRISSDANVRSSFSGWKL